MAESLDIAAARELAKVHMMEPGDPDANEIGNVLDQALEELENNTCSRHAGHAHGKEAEELRSGIEDILKNTDWKHMRSELQRLLDEVDARDSLAHLERVDELEVLRKENAELKRANEHLDRINDDLLAERDHRVEQLEEIADTLGDESEWTNLNDRGHAALELATGLVADVENLRTENKQLLDDLRRSGRVAGFAVEERDAAIAKLSTFLAALRQIVPVVRVERDGTGYRCPVCGAKTGIDKAGGDLNEPCAPECWLPKYEAAIAEASE